MSGDTSWGLLAVLQAYSAVCRATPCGDAWRVDLAQEDQRTQDDGVDQTEQLWPRGNAACAWCLVSQTQEDRNAYMRQWNADNKDRLLLKNRQRRAQWKRLNPEKRKAGNRKVSLHRYGITEKDYDALLASQDGVCAICRLPPDEKYLAVDHCHDTKRVRGLLHRTCNSGLGMFKDDVLRLQSAIEYLKQGA